MKSQQENLKVSFYLKKNVSRKGLNPVMGRITVGKSDMAQFSCKLEADPSLWDAHAGRISGKSHHAQKVNREIDKINVTVNARYKDIVSKRGKATANDVKNDYQGIAASQETLLKVFHEHNEAFEKRVGVNRAKRTLWNYQIACSHLENFIKSKYRVSDVSFRQLDYSFIENYDYYLRIDCKMMPNTVLHKMICLNKMVRLAIRKGIISHNPFAGYVAERPKTCQRYVPVEELEKLKKTPLKSNALNVTRDMFLFSCFTGLSYIDLFNLTYRQILKGDDNMQWLSISRRKNDNDCQIPLLKEALQLIEKYKGTGSGDRVFPMKSCSLMNTQLKKIASLCGIERHLTFHMSRHTFATETCLSQGVPIGTVGKMMGHKKLDTTEGYAKVTDRKVNEDAEILSKNICGKYVLAS